MTSQRTVETLSLVSREGVTNEQHSPHQSFSARYQAVREFSLALCEPLATEDYGVQPMADASPPKWHLAHTSWFFETFILGDRAFAVYLPDYQPFNPAFEYLFNSYYNGIGAQFPRTQRGNLSRPTVSEVMAFRAHVDTAMLGLIERVEDTSAAYAVLEQRLTLGIAHEQQHQELLLTDLKYNFGNNPLYPAYLERSEGLPDQRSTAAVSLEFAEYAGGIVSIGAAEPGAVAARSGNTDVCSDFCFDNELPRHEVLLQPYALANRPVNNGEYLRFIQAGGYQRSELWLASAWVKLQESAWAAPLYWFEQDGAWYEYHLTGGLQLLDEHAPVCHLSFYEACAYALFVGDRLPTEFEWEHAAKQQDVQGNFVGDHVLRPTALGAESMYGDVWEWTSSSYAPYPGYRPLPGTLGEYNGKFMSEQIVLRGGSCFSSQDHLRATYRNFFYPADRWQMSGLRLARDLPMVNTTNR